MKKVILLFGLLFFALNIQAQIATEKNNAGERHPWVSASLSIKITVKILTSLNLRPLRFFPNYFYDSR